VTSDENIIIADCSSSMKDVLTELGYDIWKVPIQVACPVHKMGEESRPSARLYEDDKSIWCFYCVSQYRPTEVWGAIKQISRDEAATAILRKWPVTEEAAGQILRRARIPDHPQLPDIYFATLERHLLEYRGLAAFEEYRKWCKAIDDFSDFLRTIPEQSQEVTLISFIERMNKALASAHHTQLV
jgi:hypothetical protein